MIAPDEKARIIGAFNDTKTDYDTNKTITDLFSNQVEKTPDHIALHAGGLTMTYRELDQTSTAWAASSRTRLKEKRNCRHFSRAFT